MKSVFKNDFRFRKKTSFLNFSQGVYFDKILRQPKEQEILIKGVLFNHFILKTLNSLTFI
jgi:hypothetical protein